MGVQLGALEDEAHPYVRAVERFTSLGALRSFKPRFFMFGGFFWRLLGYEALANEALVVLKSYTQRVVNERAAAYKQERASDSSSSGELRSKRRLNFLDLLLEHHAAGNSF